MNIFDHYRQRYEAAKDEEFTLQEFLTICRQDRSAYANAAERLLMAIGEPVMVDTALEPRLSRLFSNRVVARYPAFEEFYGMEDAGLAPIFPDTFYRLTHYWFAAADIPVANDIPVHCADAIRCNVRRPPQGSLPLLTRQVLA